MRRRRITWHENVVQGSIERRVSLWSKHRSKAIATCEEGPGRRTDVKDAEWIADLLCHGLLRPSFVPPSPIRELRDLRRYRRKLVESRSAERNLLC